MISTGGLDGSGGGVGAFFWVDSSVLHRKLLNKFEVLSLLYLSPNIGVSMAESRGLEDVILGFLALDENRSDGDSVGKWASSVNCSLIGSKGLEKDIRGDDGGEGESSAKSGFWETI